MKALVGAFNQEKALVGAFSVITNLRMEPFQALVLTSDWSRPFGGGSVSEERRTMSLLDDEREEEEEFSFDDYLMASRYGVWLLVGLFQPGTGDSANAR